MPTETPEFPTKPERLSFLKKMRRRTPLSQVLFVGISGALIVVTNLWSSSIFFERFENFFHDSFYQIHSQAEDPRILLVEIAEDSIRELGRWPWPRQYHAALTHILSEWGAQAVLFDILFLEPSDTFNDQALAEAMRQFGKVYLASIRERQQDQFALSSPIPVFLQAAAGSGHINVEPDPDGIIRRIDPVLKVKGGVEPHLIVKAASDLLGFSIPQKMKAIPRDAKGRMIVRWTGPWLKTFQHVSFVEILKSYQAVQSGKTPLLHPAQFKGKICLVGLTAAGHIDIKPTPVDPNYPAVGVHASLLNSFLTDRYMESMGPQSVSMLLWVVGVLITGVLISLPLWAGTIFVFSVSVFWMLGAYATFWFQGRLIPVFAPCVLLLGLWLVRVIFLLVLANREKILFYRMATRDGLTGAFAVKHFQTVLNKAMEQANREHENLCLVMIDIDNFKGINDTCGHQAGDMVLKATVQHLSQCIRIHRQENEADLLGRYGGEEFIILLRKTNLSDAAATVVERMRKSVESMKLIWQGKPISVTISLGISQLRWGEPMASFIARADQALYRAKREGKNRICLERPFIPGNHQTPA